MPIHPHRPSHTATPRRFRPALALSALGVSFVLAACGSSASNSTSTATVALASGSLSGTYRTTVTTPASLKGTWSFRFADGRDSQLLNGNEVANGTYTISGSTVKFADPAIPKGAVPPSSSGTSTLPPPGPGFLDDASRRCSCGRPLAPKRNHQPDRLQNAWHLQGHDLGRDAHVQEDQRPLQRAEGAAALPQVHQGLGGSPRVRPTALAGGASREPPACTRSERHHVPPGTRHLRHLRSGRRSPQRRDSRPRRLGRRPWIRKSRRSSPRKQTPSPRGTRSSYWAVRPRTAPRARAQSASARMARATQPVSAAQPVLAVAAAAQRRCSAPARAIRQLSNKGR